MIKELLSSKLTLVLSYVLVLVVGLAVFYLVPAIRYSSIVEPKIVDINATVMYERYQQDPDRYVFLDVRGADVYDRMHAKGSKLQPLYTLYTERHNLPKNVKGKEIILICSGGVASGVAYSYLEHFGFRNIARIEGGIEQWQAQGLPLEGADVIQ